MKGYEGNVKDIRRGMTVINKIQRNYERNIKQLSLVWLRLYQVIFHVPAMRDEGVDRMERRWDGLGEQCRVRLVI